MWPAAVKGWGGGYRFVYGDGMVAHGVGVALLRWACLLSMGNDNMKNKKEERERGLGDIDHVSHRHITCCAYLLDR